MKLVMDAASLAMMTTRLQEVMEIVQDISPKVTKLS